MVTCPKCNSSWFVQQERGQFVEMPHQNLMLPVGFSKIVYICADCGQKLKR